MTDQQPPANVALAGDKRSFNRVVIEMGKGNIVRRSIAIKSPMWMTWPLSVL
jgi:hypothetical protein